jgi:hypothetical protein
MTNRNLPGACWPIARPRSAPLARPASQKRSPPAMGCSARTIETRLIERVMLQTLIWRTGRMRPPKVARGAWSWRPHALLPPPIGLLVGALALLCGGLWTVGQYADHRAELRRAETTRFLDQFRSGPVAEAWQRLHTAWRAEQGPGGRAPRAHPIPYGPRPRARPARSSDVRAGDDPGIPAAGRDPGRASVPHPPRRLRAHGQLRRRRGGRAAGPGAVDSVRNGLALSGTVH